MSITRPPSQLSKPDLTIRGFRLDPVCKIVSILKDLAHQSRPIDPRLLHCCLSLLTASSQLPSSATGPSGPTSSARTPALAEGRGPSGTALPPHTA